MDAREATAALPGSGQVEPHLKQKPSKSVSLIFLKPHASALHCGHCLAADHGHVRHENL